MNGEICVHTGIAKPRWIRDLVRFLPLKSQFLLTGNVRDLQARDLGDGVTAAVPLLQGLEAELREAGYSQVVAFRPFEGFHLPSGQSADLSSVLERTGLGSENPVGHGIEALSSALPRFVAATGDPAVLLIDFASRLVNRPDALTSSEQGLFTRAQIASHAARTRPSGPQRKPFYNTIIWIAERESDLPGWLTLDNPKIRHIVLPSPDSMVRKAIAPALLKTFPSASEDSSSLTKAADDFVNLTEGLLLADMNAIAQLGRAEGLRISAIADAVRRYKVGVTEDPWTRIDRARISGAEEFVRQRVKGQDLASRHILDIIKRAVTGIGRSGASGRPRGVAFLAGPTGVGKTELAKTITSLLFGDETAYIRFDMSEFSAEHADQRLIGAPPGYVGYDAGGELTNAIREKPFSVVLFDEIEKAHPRILDKFLQILDDGVLTSGRGDRVYFSEAVILFTSNLGIYRNGVNGGRVANVAPTEPYEEVAEKVRAEIENHFKLVLNRPEILNRIGENVIVFDFIRPDVAEQIFDQMLTRLITDMARTGFDITVSSSAREVLREVCLSDLSNGGRGIRNKVEAHFVNPLSRAIFDTDATSGAFIVEAVEVGPSTSLRLVAKA